MGTFRSKETDAKYIAYRAQGGLEDGCRLCEAPTIEQFEHWRIIDNAFPYDKIASLHHMILPVQHLAETEITPEAWAELRQLKNERLNEQYEFIIEPTLKKRTIPAHFHLHLVIATN